MSAMLVIILLLLATSCGGTAPPAKTLSITTLATPRQYALQRGVDRGPDCSNHTSLGPALRGMGTSLIRTHDAGVLDWCVLFPNASADPSQPASYDFAAGDAYFLAITGEGFRPYLRLGTSWTAPQPSCIHPDPAVFAAVAVRTLAHYNDGWAQGFTGHLVDLVELFNEPDTARFWNGTAAEFYTLFDGSARALKAYDPTLRVGGPGVASPLGAASASYSFGLLDYVQAHGTPVDFFSWHYYGDLAAPGWGHSPQGIYNDTITQVRAALQQRGLGHLRQHITEWQPAILGNASVTGGAEAASFTASALTFMALAEDVEVSIFYPACEGIGLDGSWGMFADLGNGTLGWRREGRAWGAVGALLAGTPWALAAALAPAEVDYTAIAGSNSPLQAQRTALSAIISARATATGALHLTAALGSAAAAAGLASVHIYLLTNAISADGAWSNSTVQVAADGQVQVSVPGFAPPAVAWVTIAALPPATLHAAPPAAAAWRSLLRAPLGPSEDGLYLAPLHYNHTLDGPAHSAPASWYVAQWDGVQQLNASQARPGAGPCPMDASAQNFSTLWHVQGEGGLLCLQRAGGTGARALLLLQQGAALPCGAEYDLFLAPTDGAYSNAAPNVQPVRLSDISQLRARFSLELQVFSAAPRCGPRLSCGPSGRLDYGYVTLGIVLSAAASGSPGTIFYQMVFADTRQAPACPAQDPCRPFSFWYGSAPTVGISESVASVFDPALCLRPGAPAQALDLALYPRLAYAVREGAARYPTLNASLSAWQITGIYLGSGMEGSTTTQLRLGGLDVQVQ